MSVDLAELVTLVSRLSSARNLDIGCGTGWLTRFLRGQIVCLDQSEAMLQIARKRVPRAVLVRAAVPPLPFPADSFGRAFSSHVYGHIEDLQDRRRFVDEALRVANELVVVEQAWRADLSPEAWEKRTLADGSLHLVFKRYFTAPGLADELGGEELLGTPTFVAAILRRTRGTTENGNPRLAPDPMKATLDRLLNSRDRVASAVDRDESPDRESMMMLDSTYRTRSSASQAEELVRALSPAFLITTASEVTHGPCARRT